MQQMNCPTRVLFFATNVRQYNGYSYAIYELACELSKKQDIELTLYGFQNFYNNAMHTRELPTNIYEYDAFANENPRQQGFGFDQVSEFVTMNQPDICIIYNDMVVVTNIINQLYKVPNKNFKIIVYIDQVYLHQKKDYIRFLNEKADFILAFTPYWEECIKAQGISLPTDYLQHGFNPMIHYPFPKELARRYYNVKVDDFIILNLNRNQPRKRWDVCLQAFAEVVARHNDKPVKLLIATSVDGAWSLIEVFERELKKRGLTIEDGMKHLILIDNPQQLTDEDVNILYNLADIGINTCDGEGFGLCNFQQAAIGIPQVVPFIGGFRDFFNKDNAFIIKPVINLYIDNSRDGVGGESEICNYRDFVDAIDEYINNPELLTKHGQNARGHLLNHYKWSYLGDKLHSIIQQVSSNGQQPDTNPTTNPTKVSEINSKEQQTVFDLNDIETVLEQVKEELPEKEQQTVFDLNDIETVLEQVKEELPDKKLKYEEHKLPSTKSKLLKAKNKSKRLHKHKYIQTSQ
jgi:glycosyltransferase involved in cell wall biosynthesis